MPPDRPAAEVAARADFSLIRYAQCWEDTDVLLEGLAAQPGERCFSVASGGDNTLAMLAAAPAEVIAVDLSPAQIYLVELKAAGFKVLPYAQMLELNGIRPSARRLDLYAQVRPALTLPARAYWDAHAATIAQGLAAAGKFERYFALFRTRVLPLIHSRQCVADMLTARSPLQRADFYARRWDNWRWRLLFHVFFSRAVMGRAGRDPSFFKYVHGSVSGPILQRARHALVDLDPSANPYLRWIVLGEFGEALPYVWRPESFEPIRAHLDRLTLRVASVEEALAQAGDDSIERFNLSDIFEYVSEESTQRLFDDIARSGRAGGRAVYWNMMAPRHRPDRLAARLHTLEAQSRRLHERAQTFFYGNLYVDEIRA